MEILSYKERYFDEDLYTSNIPAGHGEPAPPDRDASENERDENASQTELLYARAEALLAEQTLDFEKVEQELKNIVKLSKQCQRSWPEFCRVYPSWSEKRKKSIAKLEEIAEALGTDKFNCNVAKLVGSSVGAVGSAVAIVGAILIPLTAGIGSPLLLAGASLGGLGGTTSLGTTFAEIGLLKKNVEAFKALVKEEEEEFRIMTKWFKRTEDFIKEIDELFGIDIPEIVNKQKLRHFVTKIQQLMFSEVGSKLFKCEVNNTLQEIIVAIRKFLPQELSSYIGPVSKIVSVIILIAKCPKLKAIFQEIILLHHDNPVIFEAAALTSTLGAQVLRSMDIGFDWLSTAGKLGTGASASAGKALSQALFAGVGLALDVISIALVSIDVHNGSICPYADKCHEIIKQLNRELVFVERIYFRIA